MNEKLDYKRLLKIPTTDILNECVLDLRYTLSETHDIIVKEGHYIWAKRKENSENLPTLIGHMDTVNIDEKAPLDIEIEEIKNYVAIGKNQTETQTIIKLTDLGKKNLKCLGADDRSGIFTLLKIAKDPLRAINTNFIMTLGEEIGCIGANEFFKRLPKI